MFIVVRHGNTFETGETPRRIGARTDLPLTARGREQAGALGAHFAAQGWRFSRALVSPLRRTQETAAAILAAQDTPPVPAACPWLAEIDHGPDENRSEEDVLARIGPAALAAWDTRAEPPEGWSIDAAARVAGWQALFAQGCADGPVLLVTSNGAARFAFLADPALGAAMERLGTLKLPTGGYGVIDRDRTGTWRVSGWGLRP